MSNLHMQPSAVFRMSSSGHQPYWVPAKSTRLFRNLREPYLRLWQSAHTCNYTYYSPSQQTRAKAVRIFRTCRDLLSSTRLTPIPTRTNIRKLGSLGKTGISSGAYATTMEEFQ